MNNRPSGSTARALQMGLIGLAAVGVALYWANILDETVAGLALATAVILVCCRMATEAFLDVLRRGGARAFVVVLGLVTAGFSLFVAAQSIYPGKPAWVGHVQKDGDVVALPGTIQGPVRLLVHGNPAGDGAENVSIHLAAGSEDIHAEIGRSISSRRLGSRGRGKVVTAHNSAFVSANIARGVRELHLVTINGALSGPLQIEIFAEPIAFNLLIATACALLLLAIALAAIGDANTRASGATGMALVYGLMVHADATPDTSVRAEVGALFVALFVGYLGAAFLHTVLKVMMSKKATDTRPKTARR